jgi:lauroyl/myristoyl acyltransferase
VLRAHEAAVLRDPANWFWVHNRWKPGPSKVQSPESKVENLGGNV